MRWTSSGRTVVAVHGSGLSMHFLRGFRRRVRYRWPVAILTFVLTIHVLATSSMAKDAPLSVSESACGSPKVSSCMPGLVAQSREAVVQRVLRALLDWFDLRAACVASCYWLFGDDENPTAWYYWCVDSCQPTCSAGAPHLNPDEASIGPEFRQDMENEALFSQLVDMLPEGMTKDAVREARMIQDAWAYGDQRPAGTLADLQNFLSAFAYSDGEDSDFTKAFVVEFVELHCSIAMASEEAAGLHSWVKALREECREIRGQDGDLVPDLLAVPDAPYNGPLPTDEIEASTSGALDDRHRRICSLANSETDVAVMAD